MVLFRFWHNRKQGIHIYKVRLEYIAINSAKSEMMCLLKKCQKVSERNKLKETVVQCSTTYSQLILTYYF
jgi:hypothetical protein